MNKSSIFAVVLGLAVWSSALVLTFDQSLSTWCANPQGNGNWIVQPLCK